MKILHTADWHIGKKLHNYELTKDFELFINWLCTCLEENKIDVLLISGDIFDLANPSSAARKQYYKTLVQLKKHVKHIILTGGNHDSPAVLNAPKELMKALNLEVIGGLPKNIENCLIPIKNEKGKIEVVIAAIPFLRNPDLRKEGITIKTQEDRLSAMRAGIAEVFKRAENACKELYPEIPAIAMGHLFAAGASTSESERDIQIGNQAAVKSTVFGEYFKYIALGHIHKPQQVLGFQPVFYSGSPISLSFSERKDQKRVLIIDTEKGFNPKSVVIPSFRKLIKISGNLEEISQKLHELPKNEELENLIEIELKEEEYQIKHIQDLEDLIHSFEKEGYQIVKHRASFEKNLKLSGEIFEKHINLEELKPENVFEERLELEDFSEQEKEEINSAFQELLEEIYQQENL